MSEWRDTDVWPVHKIPARKYYGFWGNMTEEEVEAKVRAEYIVRRARAAERNRLWPTIKRRLRNAWLALRGWEGDEWT